jgi:DNA-binding response OmpR family regulator
MMVPSSTELPPLRVFCLEDNPLIVFHLEQIIEDLGHVFAGAAESFEDLKANWATLQMDCALVDIDLADGRTGLDAAGWLSMRNVPIIFVTAQGAVAAEYAGAVVGVIPKPVTPAQVSAALKAVPRS